MGISEVCEILNVFRRIPLSNGKVIFCMKVILHKISKMRCISGGPQCKKICRNSVHQQNIVALSQKMPITVLLAVASVDSLQSTCIKGEGQGEFFFEDI